MKKAALILASTLLVATSFTSCKKDCPVDDPTRTELLTAEEWTGVDMKNYEDDVLVFTEDISILKLAFLTNFDVVSYIEDDIQDMVRWRFLDNEEAIELINAYSRVQEEIYDIESLTESELIISYRFPSDNETDRSIMTFRH